MAAKAVVLIGGPSKGTRFRPLSFVAPKPLFPLAGGPLLEQHVAACAEAGVQEVVLIGFFPEEAFAPFCAAAGGRHGVRVRYLREGARLGTGGGVHAFRGQLAGGGPLLVLHGDVLCPFPLRRLLELHGAQGGLATLLARRAPAAQSRAFGCLVLDEAGAVLHYAEKPETFVSALVNCGVYVFSQEVFGELARVAAAKQRRAAAHARSPSQPPLYPDLRSSVSEAGVRIGLEQDLLMPLAGTGRLFGLVTDDYWLQIKRPLAALQASRQLLAAGRTCGAALAVRGEAGVQCELEGHVLVHPTARVDPSARLGPNVTVGRDVEVGAGVRVRNAILLPGVVLEAHATVLNSIVGWNSRVGPWARVEGSDPNKHITIFGEGVVADPEICIRDCIVLPHKELSRNCDGEIIL